MKTLIITDRQELEAIIKKCPYCNVALADEQGTPYIVPMNFAYHEGVVYLHSGRTGSKVEMAGKRPEVCISFCHGHELVYMHKQMACSYSMKSESVLCRGRVRFVDDMEEKRRLLDIFMAHYTDNKCGYSDPAVRNVLIWAIEVTEMTGRRFGLRASEV